MAARPEFAAILEALSRHRVRYIVVGGVAAVLSGAPVTTFDTDVLVERSGENFARLLAALEGVIESKEEAGRPRDQAVLPVLRETLAARRRRGER